jgi:hypothetical protein
MGLFGAFAVFLSITIGWPGWVLFMTWVCFYLFGKSVKKSLNIYLQIVLGICLGILIETLGGIFSESIGMSGLYLAIFLFIGSLAFLTRIKGLNDIAAWFIGLIIFFGVEPRIEILPITKMLLLPLAAGFLFGYVLDTIVTKYVFRNTGSNSH